MRTKTARGAVTTHPTEAATQPMMDACVWIQSGNQDRSWRLYVMHTLDVAMRTSAARVHQPWQVFQRWRLQSPEGPLHQGSATTRCPEHQVFPRPAVTVSQARWRDGSGSSSSRNNFCGCASDQNLSREDVWTTVATTALRPPSNPGRTCRSRPLRD
jgi:hypothetical protein